MPDSFSLRFFPFFHSGSEDRQRLFVGWTSLGLGRLRLCLKKGIIIQEEGGGLSPRLGEGYLSSCMMGDIGV